MPIKITDKIEQTYANFNIATAGAEKDHRKSTPARAAHHDEIASVKYYLKPSV